MSSITVEEAYIIHSKAIKPWVIALMTSLVVNLLLSFAIITSSTTSESYIDASEISAEDFSSVTKTGKE